MEAPENTEGQESEQEYNELDIKDVCRTTGPSRLTTKRHVLDDDEFQYEVLTVNGIVGYMAEIIKEVNDVIQVLSLEWNL